MAHQEVWGQWGEYCKLPRGANAQPQQPTILEHSNRKTAY